LIDAVKTVELIINYLSSAVIEGEARLKRLKLRKLLKTKGKRREQEQELREEVKKETLEIRR